MNIQTSDVSILSETNRDVTKDSQSDVRAVMDLLDDLRELVPARSRDVTSERDCVTVLRDVTAYIKLLHDVIRNSDESKRTVTSHCFVNIDDEGRTVGRRWNYDVMTSLPKNFLHVFSLFFIFEFYREIQVSKNRIEVFF